MEKNKNDFEMSSSQPPFSIAIINYPQTILLGKYQYDFQFNVASYQAQKARLKVFFSSNEFSISSHENWESGIDLEASATIPIAIKAQPVKDGLSTLNIQAIWQKTIQYTEMVWKVRDRVEKKIIDKILSTNLISPINLNNYKQLHPVDFDNQNISILSESEAQQRINEINTDPVAPPPREIQQDPIVDPETGIATPQPPKIVQDPAPPAKSQQEKDRLMLDVARGVFQNSPSLGFEILQKITDLQMKSTWLDHFIQNGIQKDYKTTLNVLMGIDTPQKNQYFETMAYTIAEENPQDAIMIVLNLESEPQKDEIIKNIIFNAADKQPEFASNAVYQISNPELQRKVLFEIIKNWAAKNQDEALNALKSLIENTLSAANQEFIKNCMIFLAHLSAPQAVYDLLEKFESSEKDTLVDLLRDILKVQVEETRTRIEETPIINMNYVFISKASDLTPSDEYLASIIGTISPSLLEGNINSNILILSSFSYAFPINYSFQQAFIELGQELGRTISYIIFPSKSQLQGEEWNYFQNIIQQQILKKAGSFPSPTQVIVLDLIPYLSKPTILLSGKQAGLITKLQNSFAQSANVLTSTSRWMTGNLLNQLSSLLPENQFQLIPLQLDYTFLNQYMLLKQFFQTLLR